jgi:hypothetical protein
MAASNALALNDSPAARPAQPPFVARVNSPYFAEWEFDLPSSSGRYFDDHDFPQLAT